MRTAPQPSTKNPEQTVIHQLRVEFRCLLFHDAQSSTIPDAALSTASSVTTPSVNSLMILPFRKTMMRSERQVSSGRSRGDDDGLPRHCRQSFDRLIHLLFGADINANRRFVNNQKFQVTNQHCQRLFVKLPPDGFPTKALALAGLTLEQRNGLLAHSRSFVPLTMPALA